MEEVVCVILAAGLGKRMGSELPKVAVKTREKALLEHVLDAAAALQPARTIVVTGYRKEVVEELVSLSPSRSGHREVVFAHQAEQLGTGHAVRCAAPQFKGHQGPIVVLYGDAPLVKPESLQLLLRSHQESKSTVSLLSFEAAYPNPYGRIVRSPSTNTVEKIVEAKDCTVSELLVREVNSGIIAVDSAFLAPAVDDLKNDNVQKEFYLTDIVQKATSEGQRVSALCLHDLNEALGVNTRSELEVVNRVLEARQVSKLLEAGVRVRDTGSLFIDPDVVVETGAEIGPNVILTGKTTIGARARIEGNAYIANSTIASDAVVKFGCRIEESKIGAKTSVGPFANLRPGSELGTDVRIGNFVELKNARMADGAKANHLTYLGDCTVGKSANVGAGTITCNYDGVNKSKTVIGDGAFIGSDSCLVAPVTIGNGAYVGAGSVITKDVSDDALAFTRAPLLIKEGWAKRRREKQ